MTNLLNTKVLLSGAMIVAAAAVVIGATFAFFSDTETSSGNTFTAGSIDLSLGGEFSSDFNGSSETFEIDPQNENNTLYAFTDLKPGDMGEGSFILDVTSNEAYVCARSTVTSTDENSLLDPETVAGDPGIAAGELQNYLQVATFADLNGDNIYNQGIEPVNVNQYGGDSNGFTLADVQAAGWVPVADTTVPNTWLTTGSINPSDPPQHAGMLYCFGNFTITGAGPATEVTGCDGTGAHNIAQTDGVTGSIEFYAVQTRNNPGFSCSSMNPL